MAKSLALALVLAGPTLLPGAVIPNRTLPRVEPPRTGLHFSPAPTVAEISSARVFAETLVPIGGEPTATENRVLADALIRYSQRTSQDDFASITDFLAAHPDSPWRAALLTGLGLDYFQAAHYSRALEAWREAWALGQRARDAGGIFLADRALCELAGIYSRLGRMTELQALLKSIERRPLLGSTAEHIHLAREALGLMQHQPEISFRCGPLALLSIQRMLQPEAPVAPALLDSASTQRGFSLTQVAELARMSGLNYQMAFREKSGEFVIPAVVHWKVGHYAAIVRQVGDWYLLEDPTFGSSVWATKAALTSETSGFFLVPPGDLPQGWRRVASIEGDTIWGKGVTSGIDPDNYTPDDLQTDACGGDGTGMAVSSVHLGIVNLQIRDIPVGYRPPVGPPVRFTVRYNQRDYLQTPSQNSLRLGPRWTHDWHALIMDTPLNPLADAYYHAGGGGRRVFTGFDTNTQTYAPQQLDQTRLKRTAGNTYEMIFADGSKRIFGLRLGGTSYLTQVVDPGGNAVTLVYDGAQRLVAIADAIGQVTTLAYEHPAASGLITKVTDPFGRFATFNYNAMTVLYDMDGNTNTPPVELTVYALTTITDVLGLTSQFAMQVVAVPPNSQDLRLASMTTPYGTTSFDFGQGGGPANTTRWVTTTFPDGSSEHVEFNQNTNGIAFSDPTEIVPQGMEVFNRYLHGRNTFYWDRNAYAKGRGDYSQARLFHWLHSPNIATMAGILESTKQPLERRVWYGYAGQVSPYHTVGTSDQPTHVGRVLDDGSTQLYSYTYNALGHMTSATDPVGRRLSFTYAPNDIDLLQIRQTRGTNNEVLATVTYNAQHLPLTITDAAGQTTTYTYNARGQPLTETNPKGETVSLTYDADGYLLTVDGPLPGPADSFTFTYDSLGRMQSRTDESGYTLTFQYDAMDRLTRITHPDTTFTQFTYHRLDLVGIRDRAGRQTLHEYDNMRQLVKHTDPLGRVTRYQWCACGTLGSLTDPLGRTTTWHSDVQGRLTSKQFGDGTQITFRYENAISRLREVIDEKEQVTQFAYNRDNTLRTVAFANTIAPTPGVSFLYDSNYERVVAMTDGLGTTHYTYIPITTPPALGAGQLASEAGPLANDTITYGYDELGRLVQRAINGVDLAVTIDAAGRRVSRTSALGAFSYAFDGASDRIVSRSLPGPQTETRAYGNSVQDLRLQRITYQTGAAPVSEFLYGHDVPRGRITTWSQQVGAQTPNVFSFGYDAANQLLSAVVTNAGTLVNTFAYTYDPAGNRVSEQVGGASHQATYNALNQITTGNTSGPGHTNEWDALDRLVAVNIGSQRTEFAYDGMSRLASIRLLTNGVQASLRRFLWVGRQLCEERDAAGVVTKRFFGEGMTLESGPHAGTYFYTRDHLSSIREITDASGNVRARYAYDPYGRRTKLFGDLEAEFGFAGMFWCGEVRLYFTLFRAYDPELGRWLSRDPLENAEWSEGPNLYAYVANDPVNWTDPLGLSGDFDDYYAQLRARYKNNPELAERAIKKHMDRQVNKPPPRPTSPRPPGPSPGGGDVTDFLGNGDIVEVEKRAKPGWQRPRRQAYRPPEPSRPPRSSPSAPRPGVGGGILDMGMTILTMTDCNTVNGILGLVRQGKGGSVNIYQDRMLRQLEEIDPTP